MAFFGPLSNSTVSRLSCSYYDQQSTSLANILAIPASLTGSISEQGSCEFTFSSHIRAMPWIRELFTVKYDIGTEHIQLTELKLMGLKTELPLTKIFSRSHTNRLSLILVSSTETHTQFTQHLELIFKFAKKIQSVCTLEVFSAIHFGEDLSDGYWSNEQFTVQLDPKLPLNLHEQRRFVVTVYALNEFGIHLPEGIVSIIFDDYCCKYFDFFGEPFLWDTLQLKDHQKINDLIELYDNDWSTPSDWCPEFYVASKGWKEPKKVKANGIGFRACISTDAVSMLDLSAPTKALFREGCVKWVHSVVNEYAITESSFEHAWPISRASLQRLQEIRNENCIRDLIALGILQFDAYLLLDSTVDLEKSFLIWLTEEETHYSPYKRYLLDECGIPDPSPSSHVTAADQFRIQSQSVHGNYESETFVAAKKRKKWQKRKKFKHETNKFRNSKAKRSSQIRQYKYYRSRW